MYGSTITDIRDLTDSDPAADLPLRIVKRREFFGHIIKAATATEATTFLSALPCRRSPGHVRCSGSIAVEKSDAYPGPFIYWSCTRCGDNGRIAGYHGCRYDLERPASKTSTDPDDPWLEVPLTLSEYRAWISGDMIPYDLDSLRLIYAVRVDRDQVTLAGFESDIDPLHEAVAADGNHERKPARRMLLQAIFEKLKALG
ncbi:MAG: hypothetical protein GIX03_07065 [Candidatus Eremiobacteraeota bacterium]|nr:hypothetical protein [Candidatus Eremiobacteraeota bacterium]MBC5802753.1 hypothetical protein [Candidatus Eremiobacteraeota bacterium]MBC5821298.1 hypothetical protein [Candidatus Eremiobacteraeota bacterium]